MGSIISGVRVDAGVAVRNENKGVSNFFAVLGSAKEAIGDVFGVATGAIKSATVHPVESLLGRELTAYEKTAVYLGALGVGALAVNASGVLSLGNVGAVATAAAVEAPSLYTKESAVTHAVNAISGLFAVELREPDFDGGLCGVVDCALEFVLERIDHNEHKYFLNQCIKAVKELPGSPVLKKDFIEYLEFLIP